MKFPARVQFQNPSPRKPRQQELHFIKKGHHYLIGYKEGNELSVISALLSAAINPGLNMAIEDAQDLINALGLETSK